MKNIIKNILIMTILLLIIIKRPIIIDAIIMGMNLWKNNVFPSIFPMIIISDLLLSSNIIEIISNLIGPIFVKLFKVSKYASYVFLLSAFSGTPTNAKYINDLLENKAISKEEATKILSMSYLYNPILIITLTKFLKFSDSLFLIIANITINLIIGLINRNYKVNYNNNTLKKVKFDLTLSINKAINILLLILGTIITFITISALLPFKHPLINGILELTNGLYSLTNYLIDYNHKLIFSSILLSFGGLSIIMQIKSIFKDTLDFSLFYKSRIIHLFLFLLLAYCKTICF
jgi:hypothetical protein